MNLCGFAGNGCLGCSFCDEVDRVYDDRQKPPSLAEAQAKKRRDDELRAMGRPTLHVKFGEALASWAQKNKSEPGTK